MGWGLRGIRGAITVSENSAAAIEQAVLELLTVLCERNRLEPEAICSAVFTATQDLDAIFPSQVARVRLHGWSQVPLLDVAQMSVPGSLRSCIRVLLQVNTPCPQHEIQHVYLRDAHKLRPDLGQS